MKKKSKWITKTSFKQVYLVIDSILSQIMIIFFCRENCEWANDFFLPCNVVLNRIKIKTLGNLNIELLWILSKNFVTMYHDMSIFWFLADSWLIKRNEWADINLTACKNLILFIKVSSSIEVQFHYYYVTSIYPITQIF